MDWSITLAESSAMIESTDSLQLTKALLLIGLVVFCSVTDLSMRRIPNVILFATLMTALFLSSLIDGLHGLVDSLAGLAIGLLMLMPLHVLGRMGAGDVKLLGVVGSLLGAWGAVVAGLATMMAGGVLGALYVLWIGIRTLLESHRSHLSGFLTGKKPAPGGATSSLRAAEVPYALAIAAGTIAALLYLDLLGGVSIL